MRYKLFGTCGGLVVLLFSSLSVCAQSFSKLIETADQAWAKMDYAEAASHYEEAARLKQNRPETMQQAAEGYYQLRDYAKAAECYQYAEKVLPKNDLIWLRYGRSLKQAGHPSEAMMVFQVLITNYVGADRAQVTAVANLEIKGCQLAIHFIEDQDNIDKSLVLHRLSDSLNSLQNEFAPIRWNDDVLYFFTKAYGQTELLRSLRSDGEWQPPHPATGLPSAIWSDLGSGSLSPDGQRFYYTRCPEDRDASGTYPPCALYVTRRTTAGGWGEPERLRDYLNLPGYTLLTPFVTQAAGREVLFFASDRPGGFGGLDLYRCERLLNSDDLDFSFPQNLGPWVNTLGDEISPYYSPENTTLSFSSNGHATIGGLDVFQSYPVPSGWATSYPLGPPFSSPADDLFFVPNRKGKGGILVSNRLFGQDKTSTRHNDLFEVQPLR